MLTIVFTRREKVRNIVESEAGVTTEIMTFARIELLVVYTRPNCRLINEEKTVNIIWAACASFTEKFP